MPRCPTPLFGPSSARQSVGTRILKKLHKGPGSKVTGRAEKGGPLQRLGSVLRPTTTGNETCLRLSNLLHPPSQALTARLQLYFSSTSALLQLYFSPTSALLQPYFSSTSALLQLHSAPPDGPPGCPPPGWGPPSLLPPNRLYFSPTSALLQLYFSTTSVLLQPYFSPTSPRYES